MTTPTGGSSTTGAGAAAAGSATGTATEPATDTAPRTNAAGDDVAGSSTAEGPGDVTEAQPGYADDPSFDPSAHKVPEVTEYLATASPAERARVLAAERAGDARVTILDAVDDPATTPAFDIGAHEEVYGSSSEGIDVDGREAADAQAALDAQARTDHPDIPLIRAADPEVGGEAFI